MKYSIFSNKPEETNTPDTPGGCRMIRGPPPVVAIAEAMHYAERIGFMVIEVHAAWIPCDFLAISEGKITLVRVRRLRYGRYGLPDIVAFCTREILELPEHLGRRKHRS